MKSMEDRGLDAYIRMHYTFSWDRAKNDRLQKTRGVSFEQISLQPLLTVIENPARSHQHLLLFERLRYIWAVPCVIRGNEVFLKTLYPSRKYTRLWLKGKLG